MIQEEAIFDISVAERIATQEKNTVLFDLDNTLFDHYYSLKNAIKATRENFGLTSFNVSQLIDTYNSALQTAYDRYLKKEISYEEKDNEKVRLFFQNLSLPIPRRDGIDAFLSLYDKIYFSDRRATPGAIETLVRLNKHGFKIGVVTNGQTKDQTEKMEAIGIAPLIDAAFISEQIGHSKPSSPLFAAALTGLNTTSEATLLVGDDVESDIKGALANGIDPVLYNPISKDSKIKIASTMVPVIHHMKELLNYLSSEVS